MLFNSFEYLIFFPLVVIIYWLIPNKFRYLFLLISSYYFYMSWDPKYVFLILGTTIVSFFSAILIEKCNGKRLKKIILGMAILTSIGTLFIFKYLNFFFESIGEIFSLFAIPVNPITVKLLLPVGISFYTFQTMSYVIDVYKGEIRAEHNLGIYAAFISFFPQLVAGPIERASNLLPQIKREKSWNEENAIEGFKLMLWGYFKKLVIADYLAIFVDTVYSDVFSYSGIDYVYAIFFFTIQIYCDFSGYSDIAIGSAKVMGIKLMTNFKSPYFSTSIKEFWNRWHISLSTWFRDYVYIPLGGNRCGKIRNAWNLFATFLISGLWHGANWTYIVWGGIHGIAQIVEKNISVHKKTKCRWCNFFRWIVVFVFCNLSWVFFRANSIQDAAHIITGCLIGITDFRGYIHDDLLLTKGRLAYVLLIIVVLGVYDWLNKDDNLFKCYFEKNKVISYGFYILIGLMIIFCSQKGAAAEFVYFQF